MFGGGCVNWWVLVRTLIEDVIDASRQQCAGAKGASRSVDALLAEFGGVRTWGSATSRSSPLGLGMKASVHGSAKDIHCTAIALSTPSKRRGEQQKRF